MFFLFDDNEDKVIGAIISVVILFLIAIIGIICQ